MPAWKGSISIILSPLRPNFVCADSKLLLLSFSKPTVRHPGQRSPRRLHPQEKWVSRRYKKKKKWKFSKIFNPFGAKSLCAGCIDMSSSKNYAWFSEWMYGVLCTSVPRRQVCMRFWNLEKTAPKPILTAYKMPIFQSKAVKLLGCKDCCPAIITVSQLNIRCIKVKVMEAQTCQNARIRINTLWACKGYGETRKMHISRYFFTSNVIF